MTFRFGSHWIGFAYLRPLPAIVVSSLILVVAVIASIAFSNWRLLSAGGAALSLVGLGMTLRRLNRLGPGGMDDELPPATFRDNATGPGVRLNIDHLHERAQRALDNYATLVGIALTVIGTWAGIVGTMLS